MLSENEELEGGDHARERETSDDDDDDDDAGPQWMKDRQWSAE